MTNEEKIKQSDTMMLAKLLRDVEAGCLVPKRYSCDEINCYFCKNDLCCYTEWLKIDYIEHHGDMKIGDYVENFDKGGLS